MNANGKTTFSIKRFLPESDDAAHWESHEVESKPGDTVLDGLHYVRQRIDATLAMRYSCRMGICGSCAMVINGKPGLACNTQVQDLGSGPVKLEPLWNFSVLKDLVTDLRPMFEQHRRLKPYVIREDAEELHRTDAELAQTPAELLDFLQFSYCIKCSACVAACPSVAIDPTFPGPMPLTAAHRYNSDSRDDGFDERRKALSEQHGIAHCHYAGECSRVCPKGVDPARAIQLMKGQLVKDLLGRRSVVAAVPVAESGKPAVERIEAPEFDVPS